MIKNIQRIIYPIIVAMFLFVGTQLVYSAWLNPSGNPPSNNIAAPVNVGSTLQHKTGTLGVESLAVFGNSVLVGDVRIASGNPAVGKVLTSDSAGNVSWGSLPPACVPTAPVAPVAPVAPKDCPAGATYGGSPSRPTCTIYSQTISYYRCDPNFYDYGGAYFLYGVMETGVLEGGSCSVKGNRWDGVFVNPEIQVTVRTYPATPVYDTTISCPANWTRSGDVCI